MAYRLLLGACLIHFGILAATAAERHSQIISAELLRNHLPDKVMERLQEAQRSADKGDHERAIQRLEATLAKYPESGAWAQSMLGVEYLKTYQLTAAMASLERAVELLPHDAVNHANLGLCLILTRQYDRAEQELRRAIDLDGHNATTRELLQSLLATRRNEVASNPH